MDTFSHEFSKIFLEIFKKCVMIFLMSQTYQPKKRKRAKTHGFLARQKKKTGRRVIRNRRRKGRKRLSTV